jgi:molecular chaperone GrpE
MNNPEPPFEAAPNAEGAPEGAPTEWETNAQKRILELEAQIEELKKDKLLALAEAENAGKRADKRISDNAKYAVTNVAKALLQVADNLSRALLAAPAETRASNDALKNLAVGVELTEKELHTILENNGVRRVASLNQPFDPNLHNAIQEVENPSVPSGTVVQVFQDGYMIHDRLLRPAMVVVSRGGPKREAAPAQQAASGVDTKI